MKKYIWIFVTGHNGKSFHNPLKLSETPLVAKLLRENKTVICEIKEVTKKDYKLMFNA